MAPRGIKYMALLPPEGYGVAARRAMLGLVQAGVPVTFAPLVPRHGDRGPLEVRPGAAHGDAELAALSERRIDYDTVILHTQPEHFAHLAAAEDGKLKVGLTTWETDRLPRHWVRCIDAVDRLIVPCIWNRDVFIASGVRVPTHVVPHLRLDGAAPAPAHAFTRAHPFRVYSVGLWSSRKNMAAVVGAYLEAFSSADPTELVLKTSPRDLTWSFLGRYPLRVHRTIAALRMRHRSLARIRLLTGKKSEAQMARLHANADCYLSMSHGEGWGLGAFDAAAAGCPVVSPVHGGPRDYLGDDYPFAVDWREVPVAPRTYERTAFTPGQRWIDPDLRHAARLLRAIFDAPDRARAIAAEQASVIALRCGSEAGTSALLAALSRP